MVNTRRRNSITRHGIPIRNPGVRRRALQRQYSIRNRTTNSLPISINRDEIPIEIIQILEDRVTPPVDRSVTPLSPVNIPEGDNENRTAADENTLPGGIQEQEPEATFSPPSTPNSGPNYSPIYPGPTYLPNYSREFSPSPSPLYTLPDEEDPSDETVDYSIHYFSSEEYISSEESTELYSKYDE